FSFFFSSSVFFFLLTSSSLFLPSSLLSSFLTFFFLSDSRKSVPSVLQTVQKCDFIDSHVHIQLIIRRIREKCNKSEREIQECIFKTLDTFAQCSALINVNFEKEQYSSGYKFAY